MDIPTPDLAGKISPEEMFGAIKINILVAILLIFLLIYSAFGSNNFLFSILFFAEEKLTNSLKVLYE